MNEGFYLPQIGDGYFANIQSDGHHLRLFAEVYELGFVAVVFDVEHNREVSRQNGDDMAGTKLKAEEAGQQYLRQQYGVRGEVAVPWEMNPQTQAKQR